MVYARLIWRRCLASGIDLKTISTLEEQDASTRLASPIVAAVNTSLEQFRESKLDRN